MCVCVYIYIYIVCLYYIYIYMMFIPIHMQAYMYTLISRWLPQQKAVEHKAVPLHVSMVVNGLLEKKTTESEHPRPGWEAAFRVRKFIEQTSCARYLVVLEPIGSPPHHGTDTLLHGDPAICTYENIHRCVTMPVCTHTYVCQYICIHAGRRCLTVIP